MRFHPLLFILLMSSLTACGVNEPESEVPEYNTESLETLFDENLTLGEDFNTYDATEYGFNLKLPHTWIAYPPEKIEEFALYQLTLSNYKNGQISINVRKDPLLKDLSPDELRENLIKLAHVSVLEGQSIESEAFTEFKGATAYRVDAVSQPAGGERTNYSAYYFVHEEFLFFISGGIFDSASQNEIDEFNAILENMSLL